MASKTSKKKTVKKKKEVIKVDMAELTIGDLEDFEMYAGVPLGQLMSEGEEFKLSGKSLTAMLWISLRRDSDTTVEDVRKMKISGYEFELFDSSIEDDDEDPLDESDDASE